MQTCCVKEPPFDENVITKWCSPKNGKKGWEALYSLFGQALSTWTVDMSWVIKVRDYNVLILFLMNGKSGFDGSPKAAKVNYINFHEELTNLELL